MASCYTYTRTYTKQELQIREFKNLISDKIRDAVNGYSDDAYKYMKLLPNGEISKEPLRNTYEDGIIIGDDYIVQKKGGSLFCSEPNLSFTYIDEFGCITSLGNEHYYCNATVTLKDQQPVPLLKFFEHPEVEEYIDQAINKMKGQEKKEEPSIGSK